jgi:hypothetical protein
MSETEKRPDPDARPTGADRARAWAADKLGQVGASENELNADRSEKYADDTRPKAAARGSHAVVDMIFEDAEIAEKERAEAVRRAEAEPGRQLHAEKYAEGAKSVRGTHHAFDPPEERRVAEARATVDAIAQRERMFGPFPSDQDIAATKRAIRESRRQDMSAEREGVDEPSVDELPDDGV